MNKIVKYVILSVVLILLIISAALGFIWWQQENRMQGKLVFANAYDAGAKVNRVVITTVKDTIELKQKKGYWHLTDYDGYYAGFGLVKTFFDTLNSSAYLVPVPDNPDNVYNLALNNPKDTDENAGTLVEVYADNNLLDSVIIGIKDEEHGYFFARHSDSKDVWLVGGNYDMPYDVKMWLPNPLLEIPASAVEMLGIDGRLLSRQMAMEDFQDRFGYSVNVNWLLHNLSSLDVTDVMSEKTFNAEHPESNISKIYDIATFYGLRFELDFYKTYDDQVWLNIKLLSDSIALKAINDYIKDNKFLYDGWYFSISPLQRDYLMGYELM